MHSILWLLLRHWVSGRLYVLSLTIIFLQGNITTGWSAKCVWPSSVVDMFPDQAQYYHVPTFWQGTTFWQWHNTVISGLSCGLKYTKILSWTSLWSPIIEIHSHCCKQCQKIQSKLGTTFWQSTITQRELQISLSKGSLNTSKYIWHESRTCLRPREQREWLSKRKSVKLSKAGRMIVHLPHSKKFTLKPRREPTAWAFQNFRLGQSLAVHITIYIAMAVHLLHFTYKLYQYRNQP